MKRYDDRTRPKPKPRPGAPATSARPQRVQRPATQWDNVAGWYDELVGDEGSEYHREVVLPGLMRLLRVGKGERVLDVGCGQGVLCRLLHEKGATVTGLDAAARLLDAARERSESAMTYLLGDARQLRSLAALAPAAGTFDAATSVLAIQNIDPIEPVFEGIAWALKPAGRLVIVMMHPAFRGPKHSSWAFEGHDVQYRRIDRYLLPRKEPIVSHPGRKDGQYTWTFHRPIQSYVRAMARAGLLIDAMEEWPSHKVSRPGPRAKAENIARREIPMFMAIRAIKSPTRETPSASAR